MLEFSQVNCWPGSMDCEERKCKREMEEVQLREGGGDRQQTWAKRKDREQNRQERTLKCNMGKVERDALMRVSVSFWS